MAWEMKYQPNVVLDFDGVIHSYVSGWQGAGVVPDPPVPLIDEEIKRIRAAGYRVVVVSTRCATPEGMGAVRRYDLLDAGGVLVAIMCESTFFRSDKKSVEFRDFLGSVYAQTIKLEPGAFRESGTDVVTRIVKIRKPM